MRETVTYRQETDRGELALRIRHSVAGKPESAALILDGSFLMDSDSCASEIALADRGMRELLWLGVTAPRVLIGGLGLGLTLKALLAYGEPVHLLVIELFEKLFDWNREYLGFLNGNGLRDPRVVCLPGDLVDILATPPERPYDLLLLDIDNGPTWLSQPANDRLYSATGLERLRPWMTERGLVIFWATEKAPGFEAQLDRTTWVTWHREIIKCESPRGDDSLNDVLYLLRDNEVSID